MTPSSPVPRLPPTGALSDLLAGLGLPVRALGLILRTPRLFAWSCLGAVVTSVTLAGLAWLLWPWAQELARSLVGQGSTWRAVTTTGLGALLFTFAFVVGALTVPNLLLAPLQDPLSEATERACGDFSAPPFSLEALARGTFESWAHTLLRVACMALGFAVLWPLNLVPGVGAVAWITLSSAWSMFWIAVEHLSNPMARHLHPFREVVGVLRRRLALALGLGASLWVLLWVPVLNGFLMPVAVVAGTLLYRGLQAAGALPGEGPRR